MTVCLNVWKMYRDVHVMVKYAYSYKHSIYIIFIYKEIFVLWQMIMSLWAQMGVVLRGSSYQWFMMGCPMTQQLTPLHVSSHWPGHIWLKMFHKSFYEGSWSKKQKWKGCAALFFIKLWALQILSQALKDFVFLSCWNLQCCPCVPPKRNKGKNTQTSSCLIYLFCQ